MIRQSLGCDFDHRGGQVDSGHPCTTQGRLLRQSTRPTARVEQMKPAHILWKAAEQNRTHLVATCAHGRPNAAHRLVGREPLPGLGSGAVKIGLNLAATLLIRQLAHFNQTRGDQRYRDP